MVGEKRCAVVDSWFQTETGAISITPLPGATPTKPGSATFPFYGQNPVIFDVDTGTVVDDGKPGKGILSSTVLVKPITGLLLLPLPLYYYTYLLYYLPYYYYYYTTKDCCFLASLGLAWHVPFTVIMLGTWKRTSARIPDTT